MCVNSLTWQTLAFEDQRIGGHLAQATIQARVVVTWIDGHLTVGSSVSRRTVASKAIHVVDARSPIAARSTGTIVDHILTPGVGESRLANTLVHARPGEHTGGPVGANGCLTDIDGHGAVGARVACWTGAIVASEGRDTCALVLARTVLAVVYLDIAT